MAMAVANSVARKKRAAYTFTSAGFAVIGSDVDENVKTVLAEIGIDLSWAPQSVSELDINSFDAIHVMSQRQKITLCSYYREPELADKITVLGVDNPFSEGIAAYRKCRDELLSFYETYICARDGE